MEKKASRKQINDNKLSYRQGQWNFETGRSCSINSLAGLREELIAIEELYKEYGFGWISFEITWDVKREETWRKKKSITKD